MGTDRKVFELQARLCQVLASPKRLEILYTLRQSEMTAGDLARAVSVSTANMSQHLSLMRQNGVLEARKEGLNVYYRIAIPEILTACDMVKQVLLEQMARQTDLVRASQHQD